MCLGAAVMADVPHIVFAAPDPIVHAAAPIAANPYVRRHPKIYLGGLPEAEARPLAARLGRCVAAPVLIGSSSPRSGTAPCYGVRPGNRRDGSAVPGGPSSGTARAASPGSPTTPGSTPLALGSRRERRGAAGKREYTSSGYGEWHPTGMDTAWAMAGHARS